MKKNWNAVKKCKYLAIVIIAFSFFTACEEDFSDVGSNLVNSDNFNSLLFNNAQLQASSLKVQRQQTNTLGNLLLGVYNDNTYGKMTSNVVAQLSLGNTSPSFGNDAIVDSVVMTIPYFSTPIGADGRKTIYQLDSVYGNDPINLSIYRNNYFVRDLDPENNYEPQAYYTNQFNTFENNHEADPIISFPNFKPSANEIQLYQLNEEEEIDTLRGSPRFRVRLPNQYFQELIIDREGSSELVSNSNFQNFFRGLYFKAESTGNSGNMSLLNFASADANIVIYFRTTTPLSTNEDPEGTFYQREYTLNFSSNAFNVLESDYEQLPTDDKLYLKGGEGSISVIDIFTDQEQLDSIRNLNWLVNEANLTFYVDENVDDNENQPDRLFIYDVNNRTVLRDYTFDISANNNNPLNSRLIHLGPLSEDDNGDRFYKIRITELVNNIINSDSTNTKLGLTVTSNVNSSIFTKADFANNPDELEFIPRTNAQTPEGTVLYSTEAPTNKKLKLNIYYTEPE